MGTRDTYQKTLVSACIVAGDETVLARMLHVPVAVMVEYLLGEAPVPTEIFLRAVDVVLAKSRGKLAENRAFLEEIRKRRRR